MLAAGAQAKEAHAGGQPAVHVAVLGKDSKRLRGCFTERSDGSSAIRSQPPKAR